MNHFGPQHFLNIHLLHVDFRPIFHHEVLTLEFDKEKSFIVKLRILIHLQRNSKELKVRRVQILENQFLTLYHSTCLRITIFCYHEACLRINNFLLP